MGNDDSSDRPPVREERRLKPIRRTIANRLQESYRNAVHVTVSRQIDAEAMIETKDDLNANAEVNISVVDVLLAVFSTALAEHPAFNATFEADTHRIYDSQHVAVAVDTDIGLVTPVIRSAEERSVAEIAQERRRLVDLVQSGEHTMSDLRGSTITVTNLGVFGTDSFSPVINPPEVAILGINRIRERAVPGDDGVEFRRQIGIDLTFDHRPVDGADAARLLDTLAAHLGAPDEHVAVE